MGAGGFRGPRSPGRAHPRTCPTAARARGASQGRSGRESPGPRSWAPALPPRDRRRAGGYLPLPPAAPFPPSRAGWSGQGRMSISGWGRDPLGGGGPGPPRRRRQCVFPLRGSVLRSAPGHPDLPVPALPEKTTRLGRRGAGGQCSSYSPAPVGSRCAGAARSRRGSRRSRMLGERFPGPYAHLPKPPPGGERERSRGNLGVVVLGPLHPCPPRLAVRRLVAGLSFSCFLRLSARLTYASS